MPHQPLGSLGTFIRGNGLQKSDLIDQGFPAIHYGQLHTHYGTTALQTKSFVDEEFAERLRKARTGDLIIATTSEDDQAVAKATAWLGTEEVAVSGDAFIFRHGLDPRYVAYFFQTEQFQSQKRTGVTGTKVRRISGEAMARIRIPVPPVEIQREIADVLTKMETLEAELEAELEARRAQYAYYRNLLFEEAARSGVLTPLAELGSWYGGGTPSKSHEDYWLNGTIPWLSPKDMGQEVVRGTVDHITEDAIRDSATKLIPPNSVAFVVRSSILDKVLPIALIPIPITLNQDMKALVVTSNVRPDYVAHMLRAKSREILSASRKSGGSVSSIDTRRLLTFRIPLPSVTLQDEISECLNKFSALTGDLTVGLPAELSARRRQYEYYRDRLLTFDELVA